MLFCDIAADEQKVFDELAVFVSQVEALGIPAGIAKGAVPEVLDRNAQFDVARHILGSTPKAGDAYVLLRAHQADARKFASIRSMNIGSDVPVYAVGRFPDFQSSITAKSRLSHVVGSTPILMNVDNDALGSSHSMPLFGVPGVRGPRRDKRPTLLLIAPAMDDEAARECIVALCSAFAYSVVLLTDGNTKAEWTAQYGTLAPVFHFGEMLPAPLAARVDAAMMFSGVTGSYRMQALLANLIVSGKPIADCTRGHAWSASGSCFLRGPSDVRVAGTYIAATLIPGLEFLKAETEASRTAQALNPAVALGELAGFIRPTCAPVIGVGTGADDRHPVMFVPTNGVGLGHAQRCSLIASEMDQGGVKPAFAAFPSCSRMLKGYGFDVMPLVSRSPAHGQEHENDLVNYTRISALADGRRTVVFDGGYVFDSIYRTIAERGVNGVWIRRGMWQAGQDNSIALDREKIFSRVIVPSEVFPELNESYSKGSHVVQVGPIVQRIALGDNQRQEIRSRIAAEFGVEFKHLVISMLGGSVAADRSAQMAALAAMMAERKDTLHLIVVWPTATIEAGVFSWPNTRILKTHHASTLVAAADLYISAVGYNSFHESMYNRVPTIFMAQMNAFMDDQQSRAMAAVSRGFADIVEPEQISLLRTKITDFLDGGRAGEIQAALAEAVLPQPGNADAARIIMDLCA